ncbi:molybdenum cofactor guanylyltransferase [Xylanibacillus composti]|nr:molybdenum cofactor guanylyltransferase [Xylanibacillus composti]MDT9725803.1 molybdenum cofactor guanylyltransferase [Xylanibacillus composti]
MRNADLTRGGASADRAMNPRRAAGWQGEAPKPAARCGLILAGGRNTRMGGKLKPALTFSGETVLERIVGAMAELCGHIYVAVAADTPVSQLQIEEIEQRIGVPLIVRTDRLADIGPLGGIVSALHEGRQEPAEAVWVSAGDMPFVSAAAAARMLADLRGETEAVVPDVEGRRQPLQAVYRTRALCEAAKVCIARGDRSMARLLAQLRVTYLNDAAWDAAGIAKRFVRNVNTPEEYERALEEERREAEGFASEEEQRKGAE